MPAPPFYTFTVTRTGGHRPARFSGTIAAGATDAADYTGGRAPDRFSGSIAAGQASGTVTVSIAGDDLSRAVKPSQLTAPASPTRPRRPPSAPPPPRPAKHHNDDNAGSLAIGNVSLAEAMAAPPPSPSSSPQRRRRRRGLRHLDARSGTADTPISQSPQVPSGTVSFADGENSKTIIIGVAGDTAFEPDEAFPSSCPRRWRRGDRTDTGAGLIQNDDAAPPARSTSKRQHSRQFVATNYTFTSPAPAAAAARSRSITRSRRRAASACDAKRFRAGAIFAGTLNFADGVNFAEISIDDPGRHRLRGRRDFRGQPSNATGGAAIGTGTGTGTITNGRREPESGQRQHRRRAIIEGESGTHPPAHRDEERRHGRLSSTSPRRTAAIPTTPRPPPAATMSPKAARSISDRPEYGHHRTSSFNGDDVDELSEEFTVTLSNATGGATLADATAIGTITSDDTARRAHRRVDQRVHYDNRRNRRGRVHRDRCAGGTNSQAIRSFSTTALAAPPTRPSTSAAPSQPGRRLRNACNSGGGPAERGPTASRWSGPAASSSS